MDTEQRNELNALERALAFLQEAAPRIPRVVASTACKDLANAVAELRDLVAEDALRLSQGPANTAHKRRLRRCVVREHIAPILALAAAYRERFLEFTVIEMPTDRLRDPEFLLQCGVILEFAERRGADLVHVGMDAGFCDALRAVLGDLEAMLLATGAHRSHGVGIRAGLHSQLRHAWLLVRAVSRLIDAERGLDAAALETWRASLRHAERPAHRLVAAKRQPALTAPTAPARPAAPLALTAGSVKEYESPLRRGLRRITATAKLILQPGGRAPRTA